ncbi:MAG: transcription antitermination factor NusB [Sterolibacterium sp.]|jgi:N utilization substance protein B|nr:transcription antitermination factor NusB [Sterolibacterium sp.]
MAAKTPRRRAREFVLQGLYQWMVGGQDQAAIEGHAVDITHFDKADLPLYRGLLTQTLDHAATLQAAIEPHLSRPWNEVSPIERAILLMAACEFNHFPEVPYRVILNEAIDLAKDYGGTDGHKFINGVLDKLAPDLRPHEARRG